MARPVNADAQATQGKILNTAYAMFASRGMDGASVRDIAKGAGVSLAMVHHYFGSKQGLYEACMTNMLRELSGLTAEFERMLLQGGSEPHALIAQATRIGYRFAREHETAVRLLLRSIVDTGELDSNVREKNIVPFLETISSLLGRLLGAPTETMRLPVQSSVFLVVRYAITSERELQALVGPVAAETSRTDVSPAVAAVEEHLVDAVLRIVSPRSN